MKKSKPDMHGLVPSVSTALKDFFPEREALHLGVAVSGGPDSIVLLGALVELALREKSLRLTVLHVNHALRPEADQEQRMVEDLCRRWHLPCLAKKVTTPRPQNGVEEWARTARYQFFQEARDVHRLDAVALAHTRDDQAETVLFRLLRGAGHRGLAGMPAQRDGWIIRPLLSCSRQDVLAYLAEKRLPYAIDASNADQRYARNRIRHLLLPLIEREFSPRIRQHLVQTAESLRVEEDWIEEQACAAYERTRGGEARLSRARFLEEPRALHARIFRIWLERHGQTRELHFLHFQRLAALAEGRIKGQVELPGAKIVRREGEDLLLTEKHLQGMAPPYHYKLALGASLRIPENGWEIVVSPPETWNSRTKASYLHDPWKAIFDIDALSCRLAVRNVQPGDRMQPLGMQGRKKIHDIFIDKKVSLSQRRLWPLVLCGMEIVWAPGCVRGENGKITKATHRVCQLTVNPLPENKKLC